jgi:hypothetical protein
MKDEVFNLLEEIIQLQKKSLLNYARAIIPNLTEEDILQPNDYPQLENHPIFRYEEGVLAGMQSIQTALRGFFKDKDA